MKIRFFALSLALAAASAAPGADPQLLQLIMPDAQVVSGADFSRIRTTPFGQFFLAQLPASDAQHLEEMVRVLGFDPRRDINEIVIASQADPAKKSGLLAVRGTFDPGRILTVYKADGKSTQLHRGIEIIPTSKGQGAAFLDSTLAVAGDLDSVRAAIDRRGAGGPGGSAALMQKIAQTSAGQDAWMVSLAPVSNFAPLAPDRNVQGALQGDLLKAIEQQSGSVRFGDTIEVRGELTAKTTQDAAALADVVKFFLSMAQSNAPAQARQFASLLRNMSVTAEANAVKLFVTIPETELETLIRLASNRRVRAPRI
jgi:hypothetical protein